MVFRLFGSHRAFLARPKSCENPDPKRAKNPGFNPSQTDFQNPEIANHSPIVDSGAKPEHAKFRSRAHEFRAYSRRDFRARANCTYNRAQPNRDAKRFSRNAKRGA